MGKISRGEFLGLTVAGGVGLGLGGPGGEAAAQTTGGGAPGRPDLVVVNATVYTVDPQQPRAEAFAVKDSRFVAVGSTADVRNLATQGVEVIDAGGMTVTPGFIDAHCHPMGGGTNEIVAVNLDLRSIDDLKKALRLRAEKTPPGEWVQGYKYDDTKYTDGRQITIQDLDEAAPNNPIYVSHRGGHVYWYNTKAFQLAGVTADTADPPGGKIYKENGRLTGKVAETANNLWSTLRPSGSTRAQRQQGVKVISEQMTAAGLTSVHDAGASVDGVMAYQDAYHAGEMKFRVYMMCSGTGAGFAGMKAAGIYTGMGNEYLRIGGIKFVGDGACSTRTMYMRTPYAGRPDDYGILRMTQQEIDDAVEDAHRHNFQVGIHANGDAIIDMVLKGYERAQKNWPRPDPRHRIEHCTLVDDDLIRRIKASGSVPTLFWTYVYYHGDKWVEYGEEKLKWMFCHKALLDAGIPVPGASDYVPGPFEPMMAAQSCVTRKDFLGKTWGLNQRVSVDEWLKIATYWGAYASFEEHVKGTITAGKYADFVILGADPHEVDPDTIKDIKILRTVVGGRTVHLAA
ncbi:MAG: amidohydrolase [Acidobacteria bacterium]|nr:amidohydrolase [Acidobacteriota bacterium]